MVIVDTSIWIDFFHKGLPELADLLEQNKVFSHPFIIGELACGTFRQRSHIFALLNDLPAVPVLEIAEVLAFIELQQLFGRGIGLVDVHLLGSAVLSQSKIWTSDKHLQRVAEGLNVSHI